MEKIGKYQILETLKPGARPLYKARAEDGRVIALKTMAAAGLKAEERERFLREASICAGLDHPNLIRVFDSGEAGGVLYLAMDLLEGADLSQPLTSGRMFSWDEKLSIMEQVCEGLHYAHERKLTHRDIKPANIFLENSGRVRILDFGMARPESSALTQVGFAVGTLNYMAPEQIRAETCKPTCDIFSAGVVFYQVATGQHPFSSKSRGLAQIVSAIMFEAAPPISQLCPDAPDGLEFAINTALEKDPGKRWQSAADFKQALALCRITMKMKPAAPAKPAGPVAPDAAAMQQTIVIRRPPQTSPPPVEAPAPKPQPETPKPRAAPAQPKPEFAYCPSCTFANVKGAVTCARCGVPLISAPPVPTPDAAIRWGVIAIIGVAAALAFAVILVLVLRTT